MDKMRDGWWEKGTGKMGKTGKFEFKFFGKRIHLRGK